MRRRTLLHSLMSGIGALAVSGFTAPVAHEQLGKHRAEPSRPFIEAKDGTRLFYQDWGSGRPIVFAAPWALHSGWWEYQTAFLASRGLRCIAYDRRGHGRSDQPGRGYDFDTLSNDLGSLIAQLDLRDVVLVGHSMGAAEVVHHLAVGDRRRISRAVLVATITPFIMKAADNPDGIDSALLERGRLMLSKDRPHQIAIAAESFFGAPSNPVSIEVMEWWTRMMVDGCSLNTMIDLHRAFTEQDFRGDLRKIDLPTLLIHGDNDRSARLELTGRRSHELIRRSRLEVYEGAAHGLPITHMDRLNADILAFARG